MEVALEIGGKNDKQSSRKLSVETKQLVQKSRVMKAKRDKIELAELTKTINKEKREDVRKSDTQIIDETLILGTSMKIA